MPYYHCRKCHHEFENIPYEGMEPKCDWCGTDKPKILEEQTPLEKCCENWKDILDKFTGLVKERKNGDIR